MSLLTNNAKRAIGVIFLKRKRERKESRRKRVSNTREKKGEEKGILMRRGKEKRKKMAYRGRDLNPRVRRHNGLAIHLPTRLGNPGEKSEIIFVFSIICS